MGIIIPKIYPAEIDIIDFPIIFLAGPIKGAPNWQSEAAKILLSREPSLVIASPRKELGEDLNQFLISGRNGVFPRQRTWERYYLDLASKTGAILFWLPGQAYFTPKKIYSAMTRLELGQWMANYRNDNSVRFCVGSDGNFPELDVIRYDLSQEAPDKEIKGTLEETCLEALRIANP